MSNLNRELQAGLQAVRTAAAVCRAVQAGISNEAMQKQDKSPVTIADYASQALICKALSEAFPKDPMIAEEGAAELRAETGRQFLSQIVDECRKVGIDASAEQICSWIDLGNLQEYRPRFWTLDPIDGTKGFLRNEQYAISLALIIDGRIELGILGCPNMPYKTDDSGECRGILAWAVRGTGAFACSLDAPDAAPRPIHVSKTSSPSLARFCESVESGHSSHDWSHRIAEILGITKEPYRIDSQCKYLAVAMGEADIYLRLPTRAGYMEKIWDHAGGVLIVEEAGGTVTDIHGNRPEFHHGPTLSANEGMVVTNGQFHQQVVDAVNAAQAS